MKNSMTNMKTELKYTIFLGHRKSELAQVPTHAGFRVTSFNPYFSSSNSPSLDLVLFETQTLPNTCPGVIIGCSSYICFFPYNFIIINGIHERFGALSISAPFPPTPQVPASPTLQVPRNRNISQLSAYFFLFLHKVSAIHTYSPEFSGFTRFNFLYLRSLMLKCFSPPK